MTAPRKYVVASEVVLHVREPGPAQAPPNQKLQYAPLFANSKPVQFAAASHAAVQSETVEPALEWYAQSAPCV